MNKDRVRTQFRKLRQAIANLETQLQECQQEAAEARERADHESFQALHAIAQSQRAAHAAQEQADRARREREDAEANRRRYANDLERALRFGDGFGAERAQRELRR